MSSLHTLSTVAGSGMIAPIERLTVDDGEAGHRAACVDPDARCGLWLVW